MVNRYTGFVLLLALGSQIVGCQSAESLPPISTAENVNLERFMGDWYVLGNVPTSIEKEAFNSLESYELADNGTIATTFQFNKGALDGPLKTYHPRGFVRDKDSNAVWGMQFIWPFKAEYRVLYVNEDYTQTIIGRSKRDYLWIMARSPSISEADYDSLVSFAEAEGYERQDIRTVPHDDSER